MQQQEHQRALRAANDVYRRQGQSEARVIAILVAIAVGVTVLLATSVVCAEQAPPRATVTYQGAAGVWFRADTAREMLADLEELQPLHQYIRLLEQRLDLRDEQVDRLHNIVLLTERAEERAVEAMNTAEQARLAAVHGATAWWRHPALWFALGAVVTAGLVATAAYALDVLAD